jgi:hypothetical protein
VGGVDQFTGSGMGVHGKGRLTGGTRRASLRPR